MYSSNSTDYEKFSASPASPFGQPAVTTGIPMSSKNQFYSDNSQPADADAADKVQPKIRVPWSSGLFDCFSDVRNCCITLWCPCITFGRIAEIVDKGSSSCGVNGALYALITCVIWCPCLYSCFYRSKMRQQYVLKDSPCCDCLVHFFCESCALCQEYRELKNRGFDIPIGWHGNMERQNRELVMTAIESGAPVVEEGMSR